MMAGGSDNKASEQHRKKFFFAEAEAGLYDASIELTTPLYRLMQESLQQLAKEYLQKQCGGQKEILILDIGSGTGGESMELIENIPAVKLVAVDLSEPMHDQFNAKLSPEAQQRIHFVTGDIVGNKCKGANLKAALLQDAFANTDDYDLVISALALHHLDVQEKKIAYSRIAQVLKPGGLFLNADFFTYEAELLAKQANQYGCNWIKRQFNNPDPEYQAMQAELGGRAAKLGEAWLDHYQHDNLPDPLHGQTNKAQASILRKAGFSQVECPFMFWELGIIWALRN